MGKYLADKIIGLRCSSFDEDSIEMMYEVLFDIELGSLTMIQDILVNIEPYNFPKYVFHSYYPIKESDEYMWCSIEKSDIEHRLLNMM